MKKLICIGSALLAALLIGFCVYSAYMNGGRALTYEEIKSGSIELDDDGFFIGNFASALEGHQLSDWSYTIEGNTLYITLYSTASGKGALPANSEGFTKIKFIAGKNITRIYYKCDMKTTKLSFS